MAVCHRYNWTQNPTHVGPYTKQLQANDTQHTLSIYLAPDGNNKTQLQILLSKTSIWADKEWTGHLNKVAAWLNLPP